MLRNEIVGQEGVDFLKVMLQRGFLRFRERFDEIPVRLQRARFHGVEGTQQTFRFRSYFFRAEVQVETDYRIAVLAFDHGPDFVFGDAILRTHCAQQRARVQLAPFLAMLLAWWLWVGTLLLCLGSLFGAIVFLHSWTAFPPVVKKWISAEYLECGIGRVRQSGYV